MPFRENERAGQTRVDGRLLAPGQVRTRRLLAMSPPEIPAVLDVVMADFPARAGSAAANKSQRRAVEMPELWKAWKAKPRLPTLSTSPLEISPQAGEIPTFPQLRRRGRMEKWKTKNRFPTFPPPRSTVSQVKTRPRPQRRSRRSAPLRHDI